MASSTRQLNHQTNRLLSRSRVAWLLILLNVIAFLFIKSVHAQADQSANISPNVKLLGQDLGNQIPLLENRFRIDHEVDEVTMLFFREPGSPPVILVKPDGSKLYATMAVTGEIEWFDDKTYDLIRLKNPTPGPWQAVGQLLPGSKIMVISDIELHAEPLPEILIQGESIKLTGYITNGGERFRAGAIDDVLQLDVNFISTNNADYPNFGADMVKFAQFKDNGKGYDERPKDGVFTGELKLEFPDGEWIPQYIIRMPMFHREIELDPVIVHPSPFKVSVEKTDKADDYHVLTLEVLGDYVDKTSVIFQGKVHYPNNEIQSFSIVEKIEEARTLDIINYDYGVYKVDIQGFGKNANGREFILKLPTFTFNVSPLESDAEANSPEEEAVEEKSEQEAVVPEEPEPETMSLWVIITLVIIGNLVILGIGYVVIRIYILKKPLSFKLPALPKFKKKKKDEEENASSDNKETKKTPEDGKSDDILDLSMPDD
ncbi:TIGR03503 family protein [Flocculibacter collagenilyticus]|uniref:TIGR03503 family protein n=1 Tax=Flocculibacter collagenilyticus TaxID=2744479 RepID=UPI0018F5B9C9|nr:TIGR03503 family protein [Flocculibacter collagenilyticus]